jgi:ribosomal 50S subunit-recycling heat shock protein
MRFVLHGSSATRHLQIDWDAEIERGPNLRAAMAGHDVDRMRAGTLIVGYQFGKVLYPRGTIALRIAEGHELFLQLPAADDKPLAPKPPVVATTASVDHEATVDRHRVVVGDPDADERADVIIATAVPALSRAVIQRLIAEGHVTVATQPLAKPSRRLRRGEVIELVVARDQSVDQTTALPEKPPPGQ